MSVQLCKSIIILVAHYFITFNPPRGSNASSAPPSRPDTSLLWFLTPFKAVRQLLCVQYKWLTIKIVCALLLLAMIALFLYSAPGYIVKKMLGA